MLLSVIRLEKAIGPHRNTKFGRIYKGHAIVSMRINIVNMKIHEEIAGLDILITFAAAVVLPGLISTRTVTFSCDVVKYKGSAATSPSVENQVSSAIDRFNAEHSDDEDAAESKN